MELSTSRKGGFGPEMGRKAGMDCHADAMGEDRRGDSDHSFNTCHTRAGFRLLPLRLARNLHGLPGSYSGVRSAAYNSRIRRTFRGNLRGTIPKIADPESDAAKQQWYRADCGCGPAPMR